MSKATKVDKWWAVFFFIGFLFILYKCKFGFANIDEAYYLTTPYRFFQGDILWLEEWNPGQLSALLIYPFVQVYLKLTGTTEGILLQFRYLYTLLHSGVAFFLYAKLRSVNWGAAFASILYLLYAPLGMMALSYNSMAVGLMVIASVLLYTNQRQNATNAFFAGLAFSGAVLCCPMLILCYLVYGAACILSRRNQENGSLLTGKDFLWFTLGCGSAAGAFFLYLFSKCSAAQFLQVLPIILTNSERQTLGLLESAGTFFTNIFFSAPLAPAVFLCTAGLLVAIVADRHKLEHRGAYFLAALVLTGIYTLSLFTQRIFPNHMMFPLVILGLFSFLLTSGKFSREFVFLWIPGMLYAFCINWASTQKFLAIANAACVSTVGSALLIAAFVKETEKTAQSLHVFLRKAIPLFLVFFVLCTAKIRYNCLFWETGSMQDMTHPISIGCQKGILASQKCWEDYEYLYWDTTPIRQHPSEKVLYLTSKTWMYLDDTKRNASFSSWIPMADAFVNKLIDYYEINPSKLPDVIYCDLAYWKEDLPIARYFRDLGYRRSDENGIYMLVASS